MPDTTPPNVDSDEAAGRIVTFYSYKGGCGRTMALANVAWILASNGYRVLAVDWDLESPGLHRYFHPFLLDKELRSTEGLIEMFQRFGNAELAKNASEDWFAEFARLDRMAVSLRWEFPAGGVLDFIPPGRQDSAYSETVSTFDWDNFWTRLRGDRLIDALAAAMRRDYDYVLIDSRTGLSDTASILTLEMPDTIIDCFTLSAQCVEGAVATGQQIVEAKPEIKVYPFLGRVESGEQFKLEQGRDYAHNKFRRLVEHLGVDPASYWASVEVPYKAFYAYEEILAVFGDLPRTAGSTLGAFMALAGHLTGEELKHPESSDRERRSVLDSFERSASTLRMKIVVSHASVDRIWAEWIAQELELAGHDCDLVNAEAGPVRLDGVGRLIAIASQHGLSYHSAVDLWQREFERADLKMKDLLVLARVNGPRVPAQAEIAGAVDFANVRADEAMTGLFHALDLRAPRQPADVASRPLGAVRYPNISAPNWHMPNRRNSQFTGRDHIIDAMRDRVLEAGQGSAVLALAGMSGIGKTQIAMEYVYRFAASYDLVWWIAADRPDEARSDFGRLTTHLDVSPTPDEGQMIEAIREALRLRESNLRYLIVLDNAGAPGEYADMLPEGVGDIIVTTRDQTWSTLAMSIEVPRFSRGESVTLLGRSAAKLTETERSELAERLGDLPVALETAGTWLASTGNEPRAFIRNLDQRVGETLSVDASSGTKAFTVTCQTILADLHDASVAAARLVELCSFLAPRPIPAAMLETTWIRDLLAQDEPAVSDPLLAGRLFHHVGRSGLAETDPASRGMIMHVLVQEIIRESLDADVRSNTLSEAQQALAATNPGKPDDRGSWQLYEQLRPHVETADAFGNADDRVRQLIIDLCRYLRLSGQFGASRDMAVRALDAWKELVTDPDDEKTLLLRFQLANALYELGEWRQAYDIDHELLEHFTRLRGEDYPYTLMVAGSYGRDLRERGDWQAAREREEKSYRLMIGVMGKTHERTLMAANNYALSLRLSGEYGAALKLDSEILNTRRRLDRNNPYALASSNCCGADLRNVGDLVGSRQTLEDTLTRCKEVLGENHPTTLEVARSLATTLRWLGDARGAQNLLNEALDGYAELGPDHRGTIGCQLELACVLSDLGDDSTARRKAEEAFKGYRQMYDESHPFCLVAANDLAVFMRRTGELEASLALAEDTEGKLSKALGPSHPATALAQVNIANAAYAAGNYKYAAKTDAKAHKTMNERLEPDHPARIAININTAIGQASAGVKSGIDLAAATSLSERILGADHPITVGGREQRRLDLDIEPFVM